MTLPSLIEDTLTAASREAIAHAKDQYPHEAVGLIWRDGVVTQMKDGVTTEAEFEIESQDLAAALELRPSAEVLAIYHSHPRGMLTPSATDLSCMREWHEAGFGLLWSIVVTHSEYTHMDTFAWNPHSPLSPTVIHHITF